MGPRQERHAGWSEQMKMFGGGGLWRGGRMHTADDGDVDFDVRPDDCLDGVG